MPGARRKNRDAPIGLAGWPCSAASLASIFGDDVEPALRPLLAVSLAGSLAGSATWSFFGIWAIRELDAGDQGLGVAFPSAPCSS